MGCYSAGANEPLSTTLRRLSKHHQPDWTDAEADAQGPYANQSSSEAFCSVSVIPCLLFLSMNGRCFLVC